MGTALLDPNAALKSRVAKKRTQKFAIAAAIGIGLAVGGVWLWNAVLKDHFVPRNFGVVSKGKIFRSAQLSRSLVANILDEHGIQMVIDLSVPDESNPDQTAEQIVCRETGVTHIRFAIDHGNSRAAEMYARAVIAMHHAVTLNKPVLVHCADGAAATGGVVACYRLLIDRRKKETVLDEMREFGWSEESDTNIPAFLDQHIRRIASRLRAIGVIKSIPDPLPKLAR